MEVLDRILQLTPWRGWPQRRIVAFTLAALGVACLLGVSGWPRPDRPFDLAGFVFAEIVVSALARRERLATDEEPMPPLFVVELVTLFVMGPEAAVIVSLCGSAAAIVASPDRGTVRAEVLNGLVSAITMQVAGVVYRRLGGTMGHFVWPWLGVPAVVAIATAYATRSAGKECAAAAMARRPIDRSWYRRALRSSSSYLLGGSVAIGLAELIDRRLWDMMPLAAVPLLFAYRAYQAHVSRLEEEYRRREVRDYLEQGISVLDAEGHITLWTEALERLLGCSRADALGRSLDNAVPGLAGIELTRAINDVVASRKPRVLPRFSLSGKGGTRLLRVNILPVANGTTLLWHDVTERIHQEQALERTDARLALLAEGANDGLWEWDLRSQTFYVSARWRTMLGLPAEAHVGHPDDWLARVHPDDVDSLREALKAHLAGSAECLEHEHRVRHENGTYRRFLCRGLAAKGAGRQSSRMAGSLTDTTDRDIARQQLQTSGSVDSLTGLANRAVFVEGLGRRFQAFKAQPGGCRFAVLYLDLDRFKVINDSLGHLVGDELLAAVSRRLESCVRPGDAIARLGGDEFSILLHDMIDDNQANAVAFRIQEALSPPFSIGGREVFTSASIGIAPVRAQYTSPDEIMRDADTAMYHAKSRGKARHEMFDADMHARELDRVGLESDLRNAISHNACEVHYQPIVSLASGRCIGFESLVRWTRNGAAVSPATFVPIAEELGLIDPLGTWVLQEACSAFADWQRRFPGQGLDCITVNVSSRQLKQHNFVGIVEQAVRRARLNPADLRLEITETALMDNPNEAASRLQALRDFGVKIYLDDFGTGYSSLTHLHRLPVDALKIDCSFVKSLLLPGRPAIVESILALARTLNTNVVAEGIESEVQARELERLGCTNAQGFLFSRPLPAGAAEALLLANEPLGPKRVGDIEASPKTPDPADVAYRQSTRFEWPEEFQPA